MSISALSVLGSSLSPSRFAALVAKEGVHHPLRLALLLTLPLMAFAGIIPLTHHFHFEPGFGVTREPLASSVLAMDVARAAGLSLLVYGASFLVAMASYISLGGAFGSEEGAKGLALRAWLYAGWLVPLTGPLGLAMSVVFWVVPASAGSVGAALAFLAFLLPFLIFLVDLQRVAREALGCSLGGSIVVTSVPILLFLLTQAILIGDPPGTGVLAPWLPPGMAPG